MKLRISPLVGLALLPVLLACLGGDPVGPLPAGGKHVLFIGNSLTYTNDLPRTLAELALTAGDTIRVKSVALPNFAVIDHAQGQSDAPDVIRGERWDFVVLQQGPTSQQLYRDTLILATQQLDPLIKGAGARSAQLMTWPASNAQQLFDAVRSSCQQAAAAVSGLFIPAGQAWYNAWNNDPTLQLYGPDGFHPSELGTYLTALVVYESLTGHDARVLPGAARVAGHAITASETTVRLLQRVAHETVTQYAGAGSEGATRLRR